jgi:hypothetical protein
MFLDSILTAGLAFWLIPFLICDSILLIYWIDREYSGLATGSLVVTGAILQWIFGVDIIGFVVRHPSVVCYGAIGYFVAGTIWALIKWWFFVTGERRRYDEFKAAWMKSHDIVGTIPDDMKQAFKDDLPRYSGDRIEIRPDVTNHKARIFMWMTWWPFSALWTLINDPVRRVFREIYSRIRTTLQKISDHAWAGTDQDMPKKMPAGYGDAKKQNQN